MLSRDAAGIKPMSPPQKKNRHLVLTESPCPESAPYQCNPARHPSSLIVNLDHTPQL